MESVISAPSEETAITESDSQSSPPESEDTGSHILITYFSVPENIDISGVDAVAGASVVVRNSEKMVKAAMGGASSGGNGTDEYTKIMGNAVATAEQMKAYLKAKNPSVAQSALDMVSLYLSEGKAEGVRGDIAFAQSCLETGNFTFSGSAGTLSQNNFCGMGVTSNGVKGNSFDTPQLGIRAQVQHLKAYASTDALKNACIAPRFKYVTRGCAEYVEWLGQKENPSGKGWAAGTGYGEKILSILKGILGTAGGASKPAPAETEIWYRVRKSWADASSQKGAFKSLENAKKCADENPGHSVFDETGKAVYTGAAAFKPYLVRIAIPDLNIRKGPGTDHAKTGKYTGVGTFTIVEEADGKGASKWGLLKSYQSKRNGWVSLDFAERV
nr:glucosaminidase domain-containing protein [uncultured Acetatifactor sp.]